MKKREFAGLECGHTVEIKHMIFFDKHGQFEKCPKHWGCPMSVITSWIVEELDKEYIG